MDSRPYEIDKSLITGTNELGLKVTLGNGAFSVVLEGTYKDPSTLAIQPVALKQVLLIERDPLRNQPFCYSERDIMLLLKQEKAQNFIQMIGYYEDRQHFTFVLPLAVNGLLSKHIKTLSPDEKNSIREDIARGLTFIHRYGVVHCDLKPSNILLDGNFRASLADFGLSVTEADILKFSKVTWGTPRFKAPEVLSAKLSHSKASDVYALALIFLLIEKRVIDPFMDKNFKVIDEVVNWVVKQNKREEIPATCSPGLASLIQDMWVQLPENRLAASEVLDSVTKLNKGIPYASKKSAPTFFPPPPVEEIYFKDGFGHFFKAKKVDLMEVDDFYAYLAQALHVDLANDIQIFLIHEGRVIARADHFKTVLQSLSADANLTVTYVNECGKELRNENACFKIKT